MSSKAIYFIKECLSILIICFIKAYKYFISPLLPLACRYKITCSDFALMAIKEHGVFKGMGYALLRILKCNPFSSEGLEDVPKKKGKV